MKAVFFVWLCVAGTACSRGDNTSDSDGSVADGAIGLAAKNGCDVDRRQESSSGVGQKSQPIVGGSKAPTGAVPLLPGQENAAGALLRLDRGQWRQGCSATLVAEKTVVTAGHCVTDFASWDGDPATASKHMVVPSAIRFLVGDVTNPIASLEVEAIHINPRYQQISEYGSDGHLEHDVAILVLKQSAIETVAGLLPIPMNYQPLEPSLIGKPIVSGGYGSLTCMTMEFSPTRYWAELTLTKIVDFGIGTLAAEGAYSFGDSGAGALMAFPDGARVVSVESILLEADCRKGAGPRLDRYAAWLKTFTPDPCATMPAEGRCSGAVASYCDKGVVRYQDCTTSNKVCGKDPCGLNRCVASHDADPRCQTLDYFGRCTAEGAAEWCLEGEYRSRNCVALGQVCGKSPDPNLGYTCLASIPDAGGDLARPARDARPTDAAVPGDTTPSGSCRTLSQCVMGCLKKPADHPWCNIDCYAAASPAAKVLWSKSIDCLYCAVRADATCDANTPFFGTCKSICVTAGTACDACANDACRSVLDACGQ